MASDNEASCVNDPNFAVICGFLEKFGVLCGVTGPDFMELQDMLENTNEVPPALIELHIKLLRKVRRSVSYDRWERVLIKVCHLYCTQDAWELERFGYKNARLTSKLRILKNLCEMQFDLNPKFKVEVNRQTAKELRSEPIGRDKFGHSYWYQIDENCQLRVYREDLDEETWTLVARDREGLVRLIQQLSDGDVGELVLNEDSNSLEIEKPITDTGQVSSSVSTCEAEVDADVDADADVDESSTGNEDSKESIVSEIKTDESDDKITEPEPGKELSLNENVANITLNKNIITAKHEDIHQTDNSKNTSNTNTNTNTPSFKGTDVLTKKKRSINELAENLTKYKSLDLPNQSIIQDQVQEQEMDLSMKKKPLKVKHFASLSEPPIDFEPSDEDDEDDEDSYESDEIKLPLHMKQPRLGRPTLLGNAKKKTYSEEEDDEDEDDDEYSEAIEEPVMLVRGEGSGRECKNENPNLNIEFSEVVEESVMYFYGEGSGHDCNTGNTAKEGDNATSSDKKETEEQSTRTLHCGSGDSNENIISQSESVLDDSKTHKIGTVMIDVKPVDRIQVVPDVVQLKKNSRWDVGKPNESVVAAAIDKPSTNISIKNDRNVNKSLDVKIDSQLKEMESADTSTKDLNLPKPLPVPPKQSMFFFGPQADCFKFNSPISTHFQCTKSPSKISKTDDKPENASVNKTENVPKIEKKAEILVVKEKNNPLNEQSTENTIDNSDDLKEKQNEPENTSSLTIKPEEEENENVKELDQNTTNTSKVSTIDVNIKLDDDDNIADDKSETLSETLDSLETLIEKDDTLEVEKEKSQSRTLRSNSTEDVENKDKEIIIDSNKPSISHVPGTQIKEAATKPVDSTQIDEISSSDNDKIGAKDKDKCEIRTNEKNIESNIVLQKTATTSDKNNSDSCVKDIVEQESKVQSPSAGVLICEPTTSENILPVESKSDLPITDSNKTINTESSLKSAIEKQELNIEESLCSSSVDKQIEQNLCETYEDIKPSIETEIIKKKHAESSRNSNESNNLSVEIETVSDDLKQSAIEDTKEDILISKNEPSTTLDTNMKQDAIENGTKFTNTSNIKEDITSENIENKTEETKLLETNDDLSIQAKDDSVVNNIAEHVSQISETISKNEGELDKSETSDTVSENKNESNKSAVLIEAKDDSVVIKEAKPTLQISETISENKDDLDKVEVAIQTKDGSVINKEAKLTLQTSEKILENKNDFDESAVVIETKDDSGINKEAKLTLQTSETIPENKNDLDTSAVVIKAKDDPVVNVEVKPTLVLTGTISKNIDSNKSTPIIELKTDSVVNEEVEQKLQLTETVAETSVLNKSTAIIEVKMDAAVNEEFVHTSQISKIVKEENKVTDITGTQNIIRVNEENISSNVSELTSDVKLTENISGKDDILHSTENKSETTMEHKPEIILDNTSDGTNIENTAETKIKCETTNNKVDKNISSVETTNEIENISEKMSTFNSIEIICNKSNSCKIENSAEMMPNLISTESAPEPKASVIDKIEEMSTKTLEQSDDIDSSKLTDTNLLENKPAESVHDISKQNKLELADKDTELLDLSSNSKNVTINKVDNVSIVNVDLKEKDSVKIISKHEKVEDVEDLKSMSSNAILNKENVNNKGIIEIINKAYKIDDSQNIIDGKTALALKEELKNKEKPNVEKEKIEEISIKKPEHPKLVIEEETNMADKSLRKEEKNTDLDLKDKEKIDETDKCNVQESKTVVISSVQTPITSTNKDIKETEELGTSEIPPQFKFEKNKEKVIDIIENKESVEFIKTSVEKLDKSKDVDNFSKEEIISAELATSDKKIECQNSELKCKIEKNIEIQENIIKPSEIQPEKSIPETFENTDISMKSTVEPCIKETLIVSKPQDCQLKEITENSILPADNSEILPKLESTKDVNSIGTSETLVLETVNKKFKKKEIKDILPLNTDTIVLTKVENSDKISKKVEEACVTSAVFDSLKAPPAENIVSVDKREADKIETKEIESAISKDVTIISKSIENEESSDDDMIHESFEQGNDDYIEDSNDEEQNEKLPKSSEPTNISLITNVNNETENISIKPENAQVLDDDVKTKLSKAGISLKPVGKEDKPEPDEAPTKSQEKPKLICIDITKLTTESEAVETAIIKENPIKETCIEASKLEKTIKIDNEDDVIDITETDPLALPDEEPEIVPSKEETQTPAKGLSLATFKLDDTTDESMDTSALPAPIARALRNRKIALNVEPVKKQRKENSKTTKPKPNEVPSEDEASKTINTETPPKTTKPQTARRGRGRNSGMARNREVTQNTPEPNENTSVNECDASSETPKSDVNTEEQTTNNEADPEVIKIRSEDEESAAPPPVKQKSVKKKKSRMLGLDIDPSLIIEPKIGEGENTTRSSLRQSRRIAQLRIREEAMQKADVLGMMHEFKKKKKSKKDEDKDFKVEKKKKQSSSTDEEDSDVEVAEEGKRKHKKKRKNQDLKKLFNMENPWQSSSNDSSTQNEEEDEDEVEEELTEDEVILKSDHEFSPESDLENSSEVQPLRRARTVKKESDTEDPTDEHACQKCSKADHPEWILLCDKCDCGWHCSCLRPALLVIPEGDWFCPPCQHIALIEALKTQLTDYDKKMNRLEMEVRRKERLAYVGICLNNVLPSIKEQHSNDSPKEKIKEKEKHHQSENSNESEDSSSSESESNSEESSSNEDSEPIYQLRQRRQAQTYRFNDYDELINSAIQDELEAVKGAGNQGRGKDIATIVNAEKEEAKALLEQQDIKEEEKPQVKQDHQILEQQKNVVEQPQIDEDIIEKEEPESEEESDNDLRVVPKHGSKKKHRKLNALDVSSEDDNADDEDFKGTSDDDEEDFEDLASEDSEDMEILRRGKGRGPTRRSTRARTQRYDRDFINDDSDAEEDMRRKKKRSIWDETESEESDKDWGKRKRSKKQRNSSATRTIKKSRKRKRRQDESDPEADVKRSFKKSRIKYGGLSDSDEEFLTRRTRGKKINYIDALGSDSDDEKQKSKRIIESEDEYVANEEEEDQEQDEPLLDDDKDESDSEEERNPNRPVKIPKGRGKAGIHRIIKSAESAMPPMFMKKIEMETSDGVTKLSSSLPENIPVIAANPDNLNEEEVETMMMESEEYANKQLELMAIQLAKEKQRQANMQLLNKPDQMIPEVKQPKKRGRKRKVDIEAAALAAANAAAGIPNHAQAVPSIIVNAAGSNQLDDMSRMSSLKDPDILPTTVTDLQLTPSKRRGRGKGRKTLEKEAAATGVDVMTPEHIKSVAVSGTIIPPANTPINAQLEQSNEPSANIPETSILAGKLGIAAPPQPFSQSQPTPSVITRMLQSQPISVQNYPPTGPNQMNQKYFPGMHDPPPRNAPPPQFSPMASGRNRVPSPYRQPSPNITIYPGMRPGPANSPHRLRPGGPPPPIQQLFHSTHHALDPSPSGGGPINITQAAREGSSPQLITPPVSSPMAKDGPPPPPYNRAQIPVNRFSPGEGSPGPSIPSPIRHHLFPQSGTHLQQSSPPPRPPPPGGNFSPYHPPPPPNYHYGAYPPAPSLAAADDALPPTDYQGSPYPEPYNTTDGTIQSSEGSNSKPFNDEEGSGEFGGLVSYFSSQREDDLDT